MTVPSIMWHPLTGVPYFYAFHHPHQCVIEYQDGAGGKWLISGLEMATNRWAWEFDPPPDPYAVEAGL